jgi:hypothetical protein
MNDEMPIVSDYENSSKSFDENKWFDLYKSIIYNTNYAKDIVKVYE